MEEIWKEYNKSYYYRSNKINKLCEISNLGRIRVNNKIIDNLREINGYYLIPCSKELLHRLLAKLFIPNPENKPYIDHLDGNKHNNRVDNLRWVTSKENNNNPITKQKLIESLYKYRNSSNYINPLKGKHHTEETKKKMSEAQKGRPRKTPIWNKGISLSEEHKKKISEANKGISLSEEHKKKISEANIGNNNVKGRIHINNGIESKMVYSYELDNYINNGWKLGRLLFKKM